MTSWVICPKKNEVMPWRCEACDCIGETRTAPTHTGASTERERCIAALEAKRHKYRKLSCQREHEAIVAAIAAIKEDV